MIDTMMCHNPMEKKRQEHIKELIMTEKAYIEDMRLVHEVYLFYFSFSKIISFLSNFVSFNYFLLFLDMHSICIYITKAIISMRFSFSSHQFVEYIVSSFGNIVSLKERFFLIKLKWTHLTYVCILRILGFWKTINRKFSLECRRSRKNIYQLERYYCV